MNIEEWIEKHEHQQDGYSNLVVSVDALEEFMKGKAVIAAEDLRNLMDYAMQNTPWLGEDHPHRQSYNAASRALSALQHSTSQTTTESRDEH
jgi:hypothetical protein